MSRMSMSNAPYFARREMCVFSASALRGCFTAYCRRALYHAPRRTMMSAASRAAMANHDMACCPKGWMMSAASNGPSAEPPLPPTWKIDCARLFLPPDASCVTLDAVGWNTDEPKPTTLTASSMSR